MSNLSGLTSASIPEVDDNFIEGERVTPASSKRSASEGIPEVEDEFIEGERVTPSSTRPPSSVYSYDKAILKHPKPKGKVFHEIMEAEPPHPSVAATRGSVTSSVKPRAKEVKKPAPKPALPSMAVQASKLQSELAKKYGLTR